MRIAFVGAGNLATNLALALQGKGHELTCIYSRTEESARQLAQQIGCPYSTSLTDINACEADIVIISIKDSALQEVASQLNTKALVVHTAGSMTIDTLPQERRGVLYPMQTFSKQKRVCFSEIPIFIEAAKAEDLLLLQELSQSISQRVVEMTSQQRQYLHVAAVFACNFANHCYRLSANILEQHGIPFDVMLPLIDETTAKVHQLSPHDAQTGPAVRWDENVMKRHLGLLCSEQQQTIYKLMSESIHNDQLRPQENQSHRL